ncbi:microspherule protein 1-like [Sipha flava]|uniref:Microspherule protein 1-like n=2 Tax=Sipha flava TaxID=143950 RepID=A0A8B8FDI3_9HEMI|nr:microspherule protein 1-like [Sipha flava]XP_025408507.1 microspherule protein 1-like [Sipha flava]
MEYRNIYSEISLRTCSSEDMDDGSNRRRCRYTLKEFSLKWQDLFFDPIISQHAASAMNNLHSETIEGKNEFSIREEDILATLKSNSHPTIETFQELLNQNPDVFHRERTAKILMFHWQLMKQYGLLSDQYNTLENLMPITADRNLEPGVQVLDDEVEDYEYLLDDEHLLAERPDPVLE